MQSSKQEINTGAEAGKAEIPASAFRIMKATIRAMNVSQSLDFRDEDRAGRKSDSHGQ